MLLRFNASKTNCDVLEFIPSDVHCIVNFNSVDQAKMTDYSKGFLKINENNGKVQGDYSKFKYVYRIYDDEMRYVFTTDPEDIYVEPVVEEPILEVEDEEEVTSEEDTTPVEVEKTEQDEENETEEVKSETETTEE